MADTKQILQTGAAYTTQVQTPSIAGNVPTTSEIVSGIPGALPAITQTSDIELQYTAAGLGEENVPDPRLFKFLSDEFGFSEQKLFHVFKALNERTTPQEQVSKLLQKVLADATTNSDVFNRVWNVFRTHLDSTTNSELIQKDFRKVLSDVANAPDLLTTNVGKYLADVTALANLSFAVILVGKTLQDQTIGFSDILSRIVDFNRTFEDTAFTTDDFFGNANIDDDQVAQVFKVVLDWIYPVETFSVDVTKPGVLDQAAVSEQKSLHPQIPKFDQFVTSDLRTAHPQLSKLDQISNSEQKSFLVNKPGVTDQVAASEQQAFNVLKPGLQDQFTKSDVVTNSVGKTRIDQFSSQNELYNFNIDKPDRTDQALTPDQAALNFTRPADSDQVSISELLLTKLIGLNINEIDYFLEDYIFDITDYTFKAVHPRDQITQIVVAKQFNELVDATDDFLGAANVDDDQIAIVDKVVNDYPVFSDAFERLANYIRLFTETAQLLEQAQLAATKVLADQTTKQDLTSFDTGKTNNDQASILEAKLFAVAKTSADTTLLSEQAQLATTSVQTDSLASSDQFSRFYQAVRIFTEQTQTTELVEQLVARVSADQAVFTNLVTKTIQKIALDQTTNSEQQTFNFQAVYSDLVDATDDFFGAANIDDDQVAAIDKVLSNYAGTSETTILVAEFYRTFLEVAAVTDLRTFDFAKSVLEVVTTSEIVAVDFSTSRSEVANIAETAAKSFSTQRTETVAQADLFTQNIQPAKYETLVTSEATNYNVGLEKLETANIAETTAKSFNTQRTEIASIVELFISQWQVLRNFAETVQQTDVVDLHTSKPVTETTITSDTKTFDVNNRLLDTAATSETVAKNSTTQLSDTVDATDDFFGAANLDDDQVATFGKVAVDYASSSETVTTLADFLRSVNETPILSEVFAAATNKALSDINNSSDTVTLLPAPNKTETVVISQTISLTLQSYFSQDYVELGYTGETYTY